MEPLVTRFQVSGGCLKPPRSFIGRTPSFSSCWGKTICTRSAATAAKEHASKKASMVSKKCDRAPRKLPFILLVKLQKPTGDSQGSFWEQCWRAMRSSLELKVSFNGSTSCFMAKAKRQGQRKTMKPSSSRCTRTRKYSLINLCLHAKLVCEKIMQIDVGRIRAHKKILAPK